MTVFEPSGQSIELSEISSERMPSRLLSLGKGVLDRCGVTLRKIDDWVMAPSPAHDAAAQGIQAQADAFAEANGLPTMRRP